MDHHYVQISNDSGDTSWRQRWRERMKKLENTQFQNQDTASQPEVLHEELVWKKKVMISKLYNAIENENEDNFVDVLERVCEGRKLALSDIFYQVTCAGESLLHVAANKGKEKIVELICDHFPELLIRRNVRGDTPLHVGVRSKNSTIVKFILSQYAIEKPKHDGMRDKEITREKNEYGNTPLHEAVYSKNVDVVQDILLTDKDVVHYLNKARQSPLYLAVVTENKEILNLLLQVPFPPNQPLPLCLGNSPLHAAILERKPDAIKEILMKNQEAVYLRDEDGGTPLHYAAYVGYVEEFRMLLENSIEKSDQTVFEQNKKGHLPIHLACKRGHVQVVIEFLQHEWPINPFVLLNQKGQNILHVAAKNGKSNVVEFLLRNQKIDQSTINQNDYEGNTPLHLASINLFVEVMYFLTQDSRTNVNLTNNNYFTAQDIVDQIREIRWTYRKFLAGQVLKHFEAPMKVNMLPSKYQKQPKVKSRFSSELYNTFLVAATLMVTVTFAAAFTVPGGVYSSDNPNRGQAIFAHERAFWIFTTLNSIAMYSSVIACGSILTSILVRVELLRLVVCSMGVSFLMVPSTFLAAVSLVLPRNSPLAHGIAGIEYVSYFIICWGVFMLFFIVEAISFPRQLGRFLLLLIVKSMNYKDKPENLTSQRENKDD